MADFIRCPRLHAYRWGMSLRPRASSDAASLGTAFHAFAEAYYTGKPWRGVILDATIEPFRSAAESLFEDYLKWFSAETLEVVAVEQEVVVLVRGLAFTRRLDLVHRTPAGLVIMDHKTASRPDERLRTARSDWSLSTQALVGQAMFERLYGVPYGGFVLNVIPTGDERKFRRQAVAFAPREMEAMPRALHYFMSRRQELIDSGLDLWQWPTSGACVGRYGVCRYRSLCESGPAMVPAFVFVDR